MWRMIGGGGRDGGYIRLGEWLRRRERYIDDTTRTLF